MRERYPKRVYYLSMRFSLALARQQRHQSPARFPGEASGQRAQPSIGSGSSRRNLTPAWVTVDSGTWRLASSIQWRRCNSRPWVTVCGTNTASSNRQSGDGWQREQPDNWLRRPDPWEVPRPHERVEVRLNCSFEVRGGSLRAIVGKPSSLIGVPFDRPVVGYGGKTINTLRLALKRALKETHR